MLLISLCALPLAAQQPVPAPAAAPIPIPIKVVVIAMFEVGADTGDLPGELQYWVERDHLDQIYPLPAYHAARANPQGELAIVTGQGTASAAATIMALGLDPRFDLTHAYWIVAGIAGANPQRASLGSAVWTKYVVDGDLAYEIDSREMPADWTTGYVPLRKSEPYQQPMLALPGQVYALNPGLADWAYALTRGIQIPDSDKLAATRANFEGAAAQAPPQVLLGDELSAGTYWHGKLFDAWANQWVTYFTGGHGSFTTTAMEDSGTLQALTFLAGSGRINRNRVLVLRTVSNYDQQPRGLTAAQSLLAQRTSQFGAYLPSVQSAYLVGHAVVAELLANWPKYQNADIGSAPIKTGAPVPTLPFSSSGTADKPAEPHQ